MNTNFNALIFETKHEIFCRKLYRHYLSCLQDILTITNILNMAPKPCKAPRERIGRILKDGTTKKCMIPCDRLKNPEKSKRPECRGEGKRRNKKSPTKKRSPPTKGEKRILELTAKAPTLIKGSKEHKQLMKEMKTIVDEIEKEKQEEEKLERKKEEMLKKGKVMERETGKFVRIEEAFTSTPPVEINTKRKRDTKKIKDNINKVREDFQELQKRLDKKDVKGARLTFQINRRRLGDEARKIKKSSNISDKEKETLLATIAVLQKRNDKFIPELNKL